ncbi:hypothetical protein QBC44DRAFT_328977 [Cladorrhinum sp. PSN332]|nr:hypothetical protein QBC44DRAFT_328977 [Cladorrhinum sp. PSN332]
MKRCDHLLFLDEQYDEAEAGVVDIIYIIGWLFCGFDDVGICFCLICEDEMSQSACLRCFLGFDFSSFCFKIIIFCRSWLMMALTFNVLSFSFKFFSKKKKERKKDM